MVSTNDYEWKSILLKTKLSKAKVCITLNKQYNLKRNRVRRRGYKRQRLERLCGCGWG